jgi:hypothetical protein
MSSIYEKKLPCGCIILSLEIYKENNITYLGSHEYKSICEPCRATYTDDTLYDRLEAMYKNDYKIWLNYYNGWTMQTNK